MAFDALANCCWADCVAACEAWNAFCASSKAFFSAVREQTLFFGLLLEGNVGQLALSLLLNGVDLRGQFARTLTRFVRFLFQLFGLLFEDGSSLGGFVGLLFQRRGFRA